jgi:hypothetical protein
MAIAFGFLDQLFAQGKRASNLFQLLGSFTKYFK